MNDTELSLDEIEALNVRDTDDFARRHGWEEHYLTDPGEDLNLFFDRIPGKRMLDVGCGWARYVQYFLNQGLEYVGLDNSIEMLNVARQQFPNLRFEHGSYRNMKQFEDESFDGLWCCCIFGGEPKRSMPNVLKGLHRVLAPGGIMHVVMPMIRDSHEEMEKDDKGEPVRWHSFYELDELTRFIADAGFEVVETIPRWHLGAMTVLART